MPKTVVVAFVVLLAVSSLLAAQNDPAQSRPAIFQAGAKLALVPVVVRDRDGRAVGDLDRSAFQVFDNGKLQSIASFSLERSAVAAAPERFVAYFFDDLSLSDVSEISPLREAALNSIANLQSGDRVAILSSSCRVAQDFTGDRAQLGRALLKLHPNPYPACHVAPAIPLQVSLLRDLVRRLKVLPGARSIVVVSPGFRVSHNQQNVQDQLIDEAIQARVALNVMHMISSGQRLRNAGELAGHGDESTVQAPAGMIVPVAESIDPGNLYAIARGTGGEILEAGNSLQVAFQRVATPDSYYLLGFVPEGKTDGKYHKLKVTVKDSRKPRVRAREGYYAASSPAAVAGTAPLVPPTSPREVARTPASPIAPPKPVAERSTRPEPVMFSTRTSLVLVPVFVRDKDGRAIGNLEKRNFQIWDGGERQEIGVFNLEKSELQVASPDSGGAPRRTGASNAASAPPIPETFVAYVFDDVHITIADLAPVREAVWKNIDQSLDPSTRVAVVTTSGRGSMLDFTDDRERIRAALYRVQPTPVFRSVCYLCGDLSFVHAYKVLSGDREALQRAVPIVTKGGATPSTAGLQQRLNPAADTPLEMASETRAIAALNAGEHETELSLHTLRDLSRRMASLAGRRTIVLLGHGFFVTPELQGELGETIDRAIRSGVVIHTLHASGLNMQAGSGFDDDRVGPNRGNETLFDVPYGHEAELYGSLTLRTLAEGTGGTAIENSNEYLGSVRRLAAPPEYRYVLGFSPRNLVPNGEFHRLTIKLANLRQEGLTLQARRGYYAPKRAEGLTEAAAKEIEAAIFGREELRDLPVEMRTEVLTPEGRSPELTVLAEIDLKSLPFRQAGGRNCDDVTVVAAVFDHNGNFIAGKQQLLQLRLRDETLATLEGQPPERLRTTFDLSSGAYLVRLAVRSAEGKNMAAASRTVEIP